MQAPAHGDALSALPKLEVKTRVQQPAEAHENSDASKQSAQKELQAVCRVP